MRKDAFEEWLTTKRGAEVMACSKHYHADPQYFRNVLWWAFQAGAECWDVRPSESGALLHKLIERGKRVPTNWMLKRANQIIEQIKQQHEK